MDDKQKNMQNKRAFLAAIIVFLTLVTLLFLACRNPAGGLPDAGITFTVSFETGAGDPIADMTSAPTVSELPVPTRVDHVFTGWFKDPLLNGDRVTFPLTLTSDITVHARWSFGIPVATAADLDDIRGYLSGHFVQIADIDLGVAPWNSGNGWLPIGTGTNPFTGTFYGNGYSIKNITITGSSSNTGLFGFADGATLKNIRMEGGTIATGDTGHRAAGIAGNLRAYSAIVNSYSSVNVSGGGMVGGIAGLVTGGSTIKNSRSSGNVSGASTNIGGIAGSLESGSAITGSSSTGNISGTDNNHVGGIAGRMVDDTSISNSYSTGNISSTASSVGGIVGTITSTNNSVTNNFSTSNVFAINSHAGGIIGNILAAATATISNNAAINPQVSAVATTGRVVGNLAGTATITNNFAYIDMSAPGAAFPSSNTLHNGYNRTMTQFGAQAKFEDAPVDGFTGGLGWDFADVWEWCGSGNRPRLQSTP